MIETLLKFLNLEKIDKQLVKKIPYHLTAMPGGSSDGMAIHKSGRGVPAIYMGVPVRYIHAHNGIIYRKDYDNTVKLVTEVVKKLDKKTVASLTAY